MLIKLKANIEGRDIDVIGLATGAPDNPQFKKWNQADQPLRTNEFMSYPIFDTAGKKCLNVQLLSRKKRNSKFSAGFTNFDEVFLHILAA